MLYSIYTNDAALYERDITSEETACERARIASLLTSETIYVVRQTGNAALDESIAAYNKGVRRDTRSNATLRAAYIFNVTDTLARFLSDNASDNREENALTFADIAEIAREEFALTDDAIHDVVLLLCERHVLRVRRDAYEVVTDDDDTSCYAIYPDVDDDAEVDYVSLDHAGCIADDIYSLDAAREIARAVSSCVQCCVYVCEITDDNACVAVYYRTREVSEETAQHIREERAAYRYHVEARSVFAEETTDEDATKSLAASIISDILCDDARAQSLTLNEFDTDEERARIVKIAMQYARNVNALASLDDAAQRDAFNNALAERIKDVRRDELQAIDAAMLRNAY